MASDIIIDCLRGRSADREVLLGFAPANLLARLSFADLLDEATGKGYQRPINDRHSLDFRRYIQQPSSSTIPLTLNLRPAERPAWRLVAVADARMRLEVDAGAGAIMAQVDCQHRLGHLRDLPVVLPFMCFIELTEREELEVFNIINGKSKGLRASLLDYHEAQLVDDLARDRPALYVALKLNSDENSPWYRRVKLGGKPTSGPKRIASLRMMQQAVDGFLGETEIVERHGAEKAAKVVMSFWQAVASVLPTEWADPRRHMLTKGVGLFALTQIAADIVNEERERGRLPDRRAFTAALNNFVRLIDWSTRGPLDGFGGQGGVNRAVDELRKIRARARYKVVNG